METATKNPPKFRRVASGDYETDDGRFNLRRLDVNPPAWNVEYGTDWIEAQIDKDPEHISYSTYGDCIVDGAATKRDALILFAEWYNETEGGTK